MTALKFSSDGLKSYEWLLTRYPQKEAALLPTLRIAEKEFGSLGADELKYVAGLMGLAPARVFGVFTFYTHFRRRGTGTHHLQICSTLSCAIRGSEELCDHLCEKLSIRPGETTEDGRFTISKVECLGSCDTAPVVQVNEDYHENLSIAAADKLIEQLRSSAQLRSAAQGERQRGAR